MEDKLATNKWEEGFLRQHRWEYSRQHWWESYSIEQESQALGFHPGIGLYRKRGLVHHISMRDKTIPGGESPLTFLTNQLQQVLETQVQLVKENRELHEKIETFKEKFRSLEEAK